MTIANLSIDGSDSPAPFWYDLWRASGWSKRVARVWAAETAYRNADSNLLSAVLPTLAPEQRAFINRVLVSEGAV